MSRRTQSSDVLTSVLKAISGEFLETGGASVTEFALRLPGVSPVQTCLQVSHRVILVHPLVYAALLTHLHWPHRSFVSDEAQLPW